MKVTVERTALTEHHLLNLYQQDHERVRRDMKWIQKSSATWLGCADGVEAAAIGLIPYSTFSEEPYLWLIHTAICEQHPERFIRWSRRVMNEVFSLYPSVIGLCRCENLSGQRWLAWLGAEFRPSSDGKLVGFRIMKNG